MTVRDLTRRGVLPYALSLGPLCLDSGGAVLVAWECAMPKRTGRRWREHTVPAIIRRDGGICHLCGRHGADTADHLIPWAKFPPPQRHLADRPANLAAAHRRCNRIRGDRTIAWARAEIARRNGDTTRSSAGWTW